MKENPILKLVERNCSFQTVFHKLDKKRDAIFCSFKCFSNFVFLKRQCMSKHRPMLLGSLTPELFGKGTCYKTIQVFLMGFVF